MKRLFGCQALYRTGAVFALVWKTGRIGVKLPEPDRYQELMSTAGAESWVAHAVMAQWVLVPVRFHREPKSLFTWLKIAHGLSGRKPTRAASDAKSASGKSKKRKIVKSISKDRAAVKKRTR